LKDTHISNTYSEQTACKQMSQTIHQHDAKSITQKGGYSEQTACKHMSQTINQHDAKSITQKGGHAETKKVPIKNSNLITQNNELNFNQTEASSKTICAI
jgi:hypothetical protein